MNSTICATILAALLLAGSLPVLAQGTWTHFAFDTPVVDLAISGDNLWWTSGTGLHRCRMSDMNPTLVLQDSSIAEVEPGPDGRIWIIRNGGLTVRDGQSWVDVTRNGLTAPIRKALKIDGRGVAWALTDDRRIAWLDGETWNTFQVNTDGWNTHDPGEMVYPEMGDIAVDREGEPFILVDIVKSFSGNTRFHNLVVLKQDGGKFAQTAPTISFPTSGYGSAFYEALHLHVVSDQLMWVGSIDGMIAQYDGQAWTRLGWNHNGWTTNFFPESSGNLWVLESSPIHIDGDGQTDYSIPGSSLTITVSSDNTVWIGTTAGISQFRPDTPSPVTTGAGIPARFAIRGNSPNPFNPSTTISFTLPSSSRAELAVYSITGQRVRTLLSGPMTAGTHSAMWDGRDDSGKAVSSGVYLVRLRAGKTVSSHKMLLMK